MKYFIQLLLFLSVTFGAILLLPTPTEQSKPSQEDINKKIDEEKTAVTTDFPSLNSNTFRLINVTVFDGFQWHDNSEVVVDKGIVVSLDQLSDKEQNDLPIIDGNGQFVIPGLIDTHTHVWGDALAEALSFGVTTEIDMFTDHVTFKQLKKNRYSLTRTVNADLFSAGTLVTSAGGHGTEYGLKIPTLDDPSLAESFIKNRIEEGSDFIKIVYNHKPTYGPFTSINKETLNESIRFAHKFGKLAVVHISNQASALDAIESGADGLVHTFGDSKVNQELLKKMKHNKVFVIPTLSVINAFSVNDRGAALMNDHRWEKPISSIFKNKLLPSNSEKPQDHSHSSSLNNRFITAVQNTRLMHEQGIRILAGTDAPNPGTAHGISLHDELSLLVDSGLSPTNALQSATSLAARTFYLSDRGQLISGFRADFLMLRNDPRLDIRNTRSFTTLIKNGFLVETTSNQSNSIPLPKTNLKNNFLSSNYTQDLGERFVATSDQMTGGHSTATMTWVETGCNDKGALELKGETKAGFQYPWSGIYWQLSENAQKPFDFSNRSTLKFSVKGSSGEYVLMVFTPDNQIPHQIPFSVQEDCQTIAIHRKDHSYINWNRISGFAWVKNEKNKKFHFSLDNLSFDLQ